MEDYAHKPSVIFHDGILYHFYCGVFWANIRMMSVLFLCLPGKPCSSVDRRSTHGYFKRWYFGAKMRVFRLCRSSQLTVVATVCSASARWHIGAQSTTDKVQQQLEYVKEGTRGGPFEANWDSLGAYRVPDWVSLMLCSGPPFIGASPSSLAFGNERYPRNMYQEEQCRFSASHRYLRRAIQVCCVDTSFRCFAQSTFDPDAGADLFVRVGAKYIVGPPVYWRWILDV